MNRKPALKKERHNNKGLVAGTDGDEGYRLSVDAEPTSSVEQRNESKENLAAYLLYLRVLARLGSFLEPCLSPPLLVLPSKTGRMEYSQVVRHRFLVPARKGSNPFTPDYEHPIGSVKNELTAAGEAADCSP
ncbi:hypothetical protein L3X38_000147 (mitochondrion) [Prunus dulcis]|uniref:Uncharacterized protein n=1 Tax=Prunus dulcis TaxID=3755 RepID=A0AAD4YJG9_PRUDU|nr:hypothetical protein L3X38_000147 [Prunus dulcis]